MATKRRTTGQLDADDSNTRRRVARGKGEGKRYRVREGTQVAHGECVYAEGEQLDAPEDIAREWLVLGFVEEVEEKAPKSKAPKG